MATELSGRPGRATREPVAEPGATGGTYRRGPPRRASCRRTDGCWQTCSRVAQLPGAHSGNLGEPQICRPQLLLHPQDPCRRPGPALPNPFLSTGTATEDSILLPISRGRCFLADPPGGNRRVHPHLLNNPRQQPGRACDPCYVSGGDDQEANPAITSSETPEDPRCFIVPLLLRSEQLMTRFLDVVWILKYCHSAEVFAAEPEPRG